MEHVDNECARRGPVIHRLPGNERQPLVDADLRQLRVLDGVRPAPEHLALAKAGDILQGGLGQQDDVAGGDDLLTWANARDLGAELLVGDPVVLAVAALEDYPGSQVGVDPVEVLGMDGPPELVLLARGGKNSKIELLHLHPVCWHCRHPSSPVRRVESSPSLALIKSSRRPRSSAQPRRYRPGRTRATAGIPTFFARPQPAYRATDTP